MLSLALQCHTQIHCAINKIDVEKDIQALIEETANLSTENKSEFLLTDYFVSISSRDYLEEGASSYIEKLISKTLKTAINEMW